MTAHLKSPVSAEASGLIAALTDIVGAKHCLRDAERVEPYLVEQRGLFRGAALAVVRPADTEEVARVVRACAAAQVPMVPQGGNTGACGGGVPLGGGRAVVISTERLTRVRHIDRDNFTFTVEAGCILADLQKAAAEADCLFPLSLGGEGSCRIGGNLSTNAGGTNVVRYGNARELMLGLEVVLPNGQVWNGLRGLRKDNTGYALKQLFVGAEGTLGIITAAELKLFPLPRERQTAFLAVTDPSAALALFRRLREASDDRLTACELIPRIALDLGFKHLPGSRDPFQQAYAWYLLVELSSSRTGQLRGVLEDVLADAMEDGSVLDGTIADSGEQRKAFWRLREIAAGGHQFQEGGIIKHDVSVPLSQVPAFIHQATEAVTAALPGTRVIAFGHAGDGNIHFNLVQPLGWDKARFFAERERMNRIVHDTVHALNGSISAEHGIGMLKIDEMARYKSAIELSLMHDIKNALDPLGLMNPGKILPPLHS
jgi:D-lactate dehydrogenase (cytochrome)